MADLTPQMIAGKVLRKLIQENFSTQEEFSYEFGMEIRSVSRCVNNGINKISTIQELASFFNVDFTYFFSIDNA